MPARAAGILLYRRRDRALEVLLVHPGGPFWRKREAGAWTIPKGEVAAGEDPEAAARREFAEETGLRLTQPLLPLGEVVQAAGKRITAFAAEGDLDPTALCSNVFEIEWPPKSGRRAEFPEIDRAGWFTLNAARPLINPAQAAFLERLAATVG